MKQSNLPQKNPKTFQSYEHDITHGFKKNNDKKKVKMICVQLKQRLKLY